jgi:CheY-like chemotaxis protein
VERHRGSIRAASDGPGKGSTFIIELPLIGDGQRLPEVDAGPNDPVAASVPPFARLRRNGKLRLLLVEDHASTRNTLQALLSRRGFHVTTAASVAEARARVAEDSFDILISDLGLPDGDGYGLIGEFRTKLPKLIGVALSGYGTDDDRARSLSAGYANHLTKPVVIDALNVVIEEVLVAHGVG